MVSAAYAPSYPGRRWITIALSALIVLCAGAGANAQSGFRAQLFGDADLARSRAKDLNADLLAPRSFERGIDAYARADNLFTRHKPLDDIKEQLLLATQYFSDAIEASKTAHARFAAALKARSDAVSSGADRLSSGLWAKAEELLLSAAASLEEGDTRSARSQAGEAQGIYRSSELEAIKLNLMNPARELLSRAEEMNVKANAPLTLERAYQRLEIAEAWVNQNRYDITEARRLAGEARYEAAHAIYLHEIIAQMQENKRTFEDAILLAESAIGRIASALNVPVGFDGGYAPVVQEIIASVASRDSARTTLAESLRRLYAENEALRHRLSSLEMNGGATSRTPLQTGGQAEEGGRISSAVALAGSFFTEREGTVFRSGDTVVLRIFGLRFSSENDTSEPGPRELLSKIDHAIRLFPDCRLTVEGHTEAGGNETLNQKTSESRAASVAAYLKTFPAASPLIDSRGWGSNCPIADNTTAEGRARNRRIDVLLIPDRPALRQ